MKVLTDIKKAAVNSPAKVLMVGGLGLLGLYGSRLVLSRTVGDNTLVSTVAKGIVGTGTAMFINPGAGAGILIDAMDDAVNVVRGTGGGSGATGSGGGQGVFP